MSQEITQELLDQFLGKEVYVDFNTFDVFHAKLTKVISIKDKEV